MLLVTLAMSAAFFAPSISDCAAITPQSMKDVCAISADETNGRLMGTEGNAIARAYIVERYTEIGLSTIGGSYEYPFQINRVVSYPSGETERQTIDAVNIIGRIEGQDSSKAIAITAHYDHLGDDEEGNIYNGADDNASGVAAMLAVAEHFIANPPQHDVLIIAFDAEEGGLYGAREFVSNPPQDVAPVVFNLNLDMLGYSPDNDLWASGPFHTPALNPIIEAAAEQATITLAAGYDEPGIDGREDWTLMADHAAFHETGIPFLYLGVESHEHYHEPSDEFEIIDADFFLGAVAVTVDLAERVDTALETLISEDQ